MTYILQLLYSPYDATASGQVSIEAWSHNLTSLPYLFLKIVGYNFKCLALMLFL